MSEQPTTLTSSNRKDSVTIAPAVLVTIVRMAALSVEGVRKTTKPPIVDRWFRRFMSDDGISVEVIDGAVQINIHLVVSGLRSLNNISRLVQEEVTHTITDYVGMPVSAVNVHIEDIDFSND